jgi:hypothetical protein
MSESSVSRRPWNQHTSGDGEPEFKIRPRAPRPSRSENQSLTGFRRVMQIFYSSARKVAARSAVSRPKSFSANQRCAVRVSYSPNKTKGQWRAHGRYLERDSAIGENAPFNQAENSVDLQERLAAWQSAGDQHMFKLILSPEFGDRLDLPKLTREFMKRMEDRTGATLEWVAVVHNNTEHPHVHIAIRGVAGGQELRLDRDLIRTGLRQEAERLCTLTLGYRTEQDIHESQRREVGFTRATSLDRQIQKRATPVASGDLRFELPQGNRDFFQLMASRMATLSGMGLAKPEGNGWNLRVDFLQVLKTMQQAGDRQKMLHQYGILLSDPRLPSQVTRARDIERLEGRVLAHVYDDTTGAPQMILEGTDARVHFIRHSTAMEEMRRAGSLKPNSFVTIRRSEECQSNHQLKIEDFGDSDKYLSSDHMKYSARRLIQKGIIGGGGEEHGGWLGSYYQKLSESADPVRSHAVYDGTRGSLPGKSRAR